MLRQKLHHIRTAPGRMMLQQFCQHMSGLLVLALGEGLHTDCGMASGFFSHQSMHDGQSTHTGLRLKGNQDTSCRLFICTQCSIQGIGCNAADLSWQSSTLSSLEVPFA